MVADTIKQGGKWVSKNEWTATSSTVLPTHEPFVGRNKPPRPAALNPIETAFRAADYRNRAVSGTASTNGATATEPSTFFELSTSGLPIQGVNDTDAGIIAAAEKMLGMRRLAPDRVNEQPDPVRAIQGFTLAETKALLAQIGKTESDGRYDSINPATGYVGKYQFGIAALIDRGYIKPEYLKYGNQALTGVVTIDGKSVNVNPWRGENGINSLQDFLNAKELQETIMIQHAEANIKTMLANGALKTTDSTEVRAGMVAVAHLLGPNRGTDKRPGALGWRYTGQGQDANNTTGTDYFNYGRYAMQALVPKTLLAGQTPAPATSTTSG